MGMLTAGLVLRSRAIGRRAERRRCDLCGTPLPDGAGRFCEKLPGAAESCEDVYSKAHGELAAGVRAAGGMTFDGNKSRGGGNTIRRAIKSDRERERDRREAASRALRKMTLEPEAG